VLTPGLPQPTPMPQQLALATLAPTSLPRDDCNHPYYPLRLGATWSYRRTSPVLHPGERLLEVTQTVTQIAPATTGVRATLVITTANTRPELSDLGITEEVTGTEALCSPQGIQFETYPLFAPSVVANLAMSTTTRARGVWLPSASQVVVGAAWEDQYGLEQSVISFNDTRRFQNVVLYDIQMHFTAVGYEHVQVPAGSFDALKVEQHTTGAITLQIHSGGTPVLSYEQVFWYVAGIGIVKVASSTDSRVMELTHVSIP